MYRLLLCCLFLLNMVVPSHVEHWNGTQATADTDGTLIVNGYERHFVYAVAASAAPATGRPLVIFLHGDGGTPTLSDAWKQAVLNDSNGAVLLAAEGRNNIPAAAAIDGSGWRFRMDETGRPYDDIDFINQLITQATAGSTLLGTTIDAQQVYVVGESRGAGFAYYLYADPRTRNKIRAIVPISGTFYCDGDAVNPGTPGTTPQPGSDVTCGEVNAETGWYWGPKASLFSPPGVTRPVHILDVHGQLPPNGGEGEDTAPPLIDVDYGSSSWTGWGDVAGCYTVKVSSQTEQTLPKPIGGKTVKTYAYSQAEGDLATRCAGLDLTFFIAQGGGHVPGGFEPTAWCYLSTVGGTPSSTACGSSVPPSPPSDGPTLSANVAAARKPISEDIYGLHEADEAFAAEIGLPVRRYGGNLATRYNWQTNTTNSGIDYYFANRPADISADDFVARDRRTGTKSILTIPMTGWVAKDGSNDTCGFNVQTYSYTPQPFAGNPAINPANPQCGTGITGFNGGGDPVFFKPVDPHDTSVPFGPDDARAWIEHLTTTYGSAAQGGVPFYSLDNEPDSWSITHADLVPIALKYQEFRDRSIQYAAAVKQADPAAQTLGPAPGSYAYYFNSFYDGQREDWETPDDRNANGGTPFLEWYLQQMRAYEQTNGVRLLDYLDVHWYPQAGQYNNPAGDDAMQALRLRSTRSLWDPTYVDESWIKDSGPDGGVVQLIPRLHDMVAKNYPGTKIAISEYSWGAHADLNGALAQADVLGIFGREGVDLATLFDGTYENDNAKFAPDRPSAYAFRMYRNYDGQGSRFGETSVQASSSDQDKLAIYAAQRSGDGALTLMVINKTKGDLSSPVTLSGFVPGGNAAVYRYSATNLKAIARQADQPVTANGLNANFPAESITLLVIPRADNSQLQVFLPLIRR
ncbi:MAG TPA: glycoside hydrolase family 44 protein [Roseiflexaceae bacterium]|nr:glycoside hydrolase family 44 protein [Roseiflexaceae bacterium]